jgi:cytochrome c oxidase cbb3-type subunit 3
MTRPLEEEAPALVDPSELPEGVTLRDHVYDGIQEYDQKLPNWWLATFYGAIIFFVGYWFSFYQLGYAETDHERLEARVRDIRARQAAGFERQLASLSDERFWEMSRDPEVVAAGKASYDSTCIACHGADLSATIAGVKLPGQPLNDAEWKYGHRPMEVFKIVTSGSPDPASGMQAWEPVLGARKVAEVVAYVLSHHQPPAPGAGGG